MSLLPRPRPRALLAAAALLTACASGTSSSPPYDPLAAGGSGGAGGAGPSGGAGLSAAGGAGGGGAGGKAGGQSGAAGSPASGSGGSAGATGKAGGGGASAASAGSAGAAASAGSSGSAGTAASAGSAGSGAAGSAGGAGGAAAGGGGAAGGPAGSPAAGGGSGGAGPAGGAGTGGASGAAGAGGGAPLSCPDGTTMIFDRTACPAQGAPPPDALVGVAQTASRGDLFSLGGVDEGKAPCIPVLVCAPAQAPTLLFSDEPESPASDGVLYADSVGPGAYRVYVYHVNGGAGLRKFPVVVLNQGASDAHITLGRRGLAGPSSSYIAAGKAAAAAWLADASSTEVLVPAGQRVLLAPELDALHASTGQLVHAILDLSVDAAVKISVVSVDAGADAASATAGLSLLPDDGMHTRGTFAGADVVLQATLPLDGALRHLALGDNVTEMTLEGTDKVDQKSVKLGGNYGLVYRFRFAPGPSVAFGLVPRGGAWGGAADVPAGLDGAAGVTPLPAVAESVPDAQSAALLGRFAAGASPSFSLLSAGGSSLPTDLMAVPLP